MSDDQPIIEDIPPLHYSENEVKAIVRIFNVFADALQTISLTVRTSAHQADEAMEAWYQGLDDETKALVQRISEESRG